MWEYVVANQSTILRLVREHMELTLSAILLAVIIGLPVGVLITRRERVADIVISLANTGQTVPSLAVLALMVPLLGIGFLPAVIALFVKAVLPVIRNTYVGIRSIDPFVIESGLGMGMTEWQMLFRVELPLALPVIMAGLRTASIFAVSFAVLAAAIGAGGLGELIFSGIALNDPRMLLAGSIPTALLAVVVDVLLGGAERLLGRRYGRRA